MSRLPSRLVAVKMTSSNRTSGSRPTRQRQCCFILYPKKRRPVVKMALRSPDPNSESTGILVRHTRGGTSLQRRRELDDVENVIGDGKTERARLQAINQKDQDTFRRRSPLI